MFENTITECVTSESIIKCHRLVRHTYHSLDVKGVFDLDCLLPFLNPGVEEEDDLWFRCTRGFALFDVMLLTVKDDEAVS